MPECEKHREKYPEEGVCPRCIEDQVMSKSRISADQVQQDAKSKELTPRERAEAHWNGYVGPMMRVMMDAAIEMSKFHYISSHLHGTKHGHEDKDNG